MKINDKTKAGFSRKDYAEHAVKWEGSGISQKRYCASWGLSYSQFVTSRSNLLISRGKSRPQKKAPAQFVELKSGLSKASEQSLFTSEPKSGQIIIRSHKGNIIELPPTLSSEHLSMILGVLGGML
jgi:hypothetical protein